MILAGTAVGAGMLAMPLEAAEIWYTNAVGALLLCWLGMNLSAWMILEANLHFPVGSSFETFAPVLLSPPERVANTASVIFVHFILTYAYITGGGALVAVSAEAIGGLDVWPAVARLLFAGILVIPVVHSAQTVERLSTLMMIGMGATFLLSMSGLAVHIDPSNLLADWRGGAVRSRPRLLVDMWRALPSMLTAFGVHGNVPSMYKLCLLRALRV